MSTSFVVCKVLYYHTRQLTGVSTKNQIHTSVSCPRYSHGVALVVGVVTVVNTVQVLRQLPSELHMNFDDVIDI